MPTQPKQSETPNKTDCPRTDAASHEIMTNKRGDHLDWPSFARQLERELTAANAVIEELKSAKREWENTGWDELRAARNKLIAERDAANAELERITASAAALYAAQEPLEAELGQLRERLLAFEIEVRLADAVLSKLPSWKANGIKIPNDVYAVVEETLGHLDTALDAAMKGKE